MFLMPWIGVGGTGGEDGSLNMNDLWVKGRIVGIEIETVCFDEAGSDGDIIFFCSTIRCYFLRHILVYKSRLGELYIYFRLNIWIYNSHSSPMPYYHS